MKRLLVLASLLLAPLASQAQTLVLSDFNSFTPDYYSTAGGSGDWSEFTAQAGATSFTIGNVGTGIPSGLIGNGFLKFYGELQDWSPYSAVTLTGFTAASNATPSLYFYAESMSEDGNPSFALTKFDLGAFGSGPVSASITAPLALAGLDLTHIDAWGFVVQEAGNPAFGFTFDQVALTAIPEPSAYAACLGAVALAVAGLRRRRLQSV
jgi:hypothetical protein